MFQKENGHVLMRVKASTTDPIWIGRFGPNSEGWRVLRDKPLGSPRFVPPRAIDQAQISQLHLLFPHIPIREFVAEWEAIIEEPAIVAKDVPAYMRDPSYHWLAADFNRVLFIL